MLSLVCLLVSFILITTKEIKDNASVNCPVVLGCGDVTHRKGLTVVISTEDHTLEMRTADDKMRSMKMMSHLRSRCIQHHKKQSQMA